MAELDTIFVTNPTDEDFTCRYNGEPYLIKAGETRERPQFLAIHMAKQLSDKMLGEDTVKLLARKRKEKREIQFDPEIAQITVYDNPQRRIYLYQILKSKELVERVINAYPLKGFVGEMREYDEFVAKQEATATSGEGKETKKED